MLGYGLYIGNLIPFINYFLRYHHHITSLRPLNSPTPHPPHLFEHLLALVDLFLSFLHKHQHLLQCFGSIYTISPSYFLQLTTLHDTMPHGLLLSSTQQTIHRFQNPASIWISWYFFYIETTGPNDIHCGIYPHPTCFSYSCKAPELFHFLYPFSICSFMSKITMCSGRKKKSQRGDRASLRPATM